MFDPQEHLIQLPRRVKQKDGTWKTLSDLYLEVKWRVLMFRERWPHGVITTEEIHVDLDLGYARFKATVEDGQGGKATGYGTETQADFMDFVERAETRALGRALAVLGFGTQFVGQDLTEGEHVADAPVVVATGEAVPANSGEFRPDTGQNSSNGDPRPATIPLDAKLPCGGLSITDLKPGQLAMLLSKVAGLVHAEGDHWVPLLAALQAERARRQAPGRIVPVQAPVPTGDVPDHAPPTGAIETSAEERTAAAKTAEPEEFSIPNIENPLSSQPPKPDHETAERQRWSRLSRRSMATGLSASVWESLRLGAYVDAERVILALEQATAGRAEMDPIILLAYWSDRVEHFGGTRRELPRLLRRYCRGVTHVVVYEARETIWDVGHVTRALERWQRAGTSNPRGSAPATAETWSGRSRGRSGAQS